MFPKYLKKYIFKIMFSSAVTHFSLIFIKYIHIMCQHEEGWNKKITRGVLEPLLCSGPLLLLWSVLLFLINYSFTNAKKKKKDK